jgi:hypothetical protein
MNEAIKQGFHERMLAIYHQVGRSTGYWPHRFLVAVRNHGGLAAAKNFLNDPTVSGGFERLKEIGRLDFAVEALVLKKPWSQLFTRREREIAGKRLEEYGYHLSAKCLGRHTMEDWTVLKHFVVYHNPDERGFSLRGNPPKSIVTSKSVKHLIGNRVWLVTGEGAPRRYFLAATFIVDQIATDGPPHVPNVASGNNGQSFRPLLSMNGEHWFPDFLERNGHFGFGLNEVTNHPEYVDGLWHLANRRREEKIVDEIRLNPKINQTTKQALIDARRGQGYFKKCLMEIEHCCRLTKVSNPDHLIASHCKPWKDSSDEERLDGNNGLLLSPNVDHLFNNGVISFNADGDLLISPQADKKSLRRMGVETAKRMNVGIFTAKQKDYLAYHRENVFK